MKDINLVRREINEKVGKMDEDELKKIRSWSLNDIMQELDDLLISKGHHDHIDRMDAYEAISLIHSEVSEYAQLYKHHGWDAKFREQRAEELADIIFRTLNLALMEGIDINKAMYKKMLINWERPYKFGTPEERSEDDGGTDA